MAESTIYELPWAFFLAGNNELKLRAKTTEQGGKEAADALMFRFQVPQANLEGSGWIGCITADVMESDGDERVKIKLGLKLDPGPVIEMYAMRPGGQEDRDEIRVFRFGLAGCEFGVPVKGLGGGAAPAPQRVTRFYSDDGAYCFNVQGDDGGKMVQYRIVNPGDESTWEPVAQWKGQR